MADEQQMTATELKQWWDAENAILGFKAQHEGNRVIAEVVTQLVNVIEAQEKQIALMQTKTNLKDVLHGEGDLHGQWVVVASFHWMAEGNDFIGVYSSMKLAQDECKRFGDKYKWEIPKWTEDTYTEGARSKNTISDNPSGEHYTCEWIMID